MDVAPVPRLSGLGANKFEALVKLGQPFIMTDLVSQWPCCHLWTPEYLMGLHAQEAQVMVAKNNQHFLDNDQLVEKISVPFAEAISYIFSNVKVCHSFPCSLLMPTVRDSFLAKTGDLTYCFFQNEKFSPLHSNWDFTLGIRRAYLRMLLTDELFAAIDPPRHLFHREGIVTLSDAEDQTFLTITMKCLHTGEFFRRHLMRIWIGTKGQHPAFFLISPVTHIFANPSLSLF